MDAVSHIPAFQLFADRYEIVTRLGRGRRGSVYHARDRALQNHHVALKVLATDGGTATLRQLRREVLYARKIRSPHVAQLFEFGVTKQLIPYMVLELVSGGTLRRYLDDQNVLRNSPEIIRLFWEVCLGIRAAHKKGIIHRDIKPDNILLTDNRSVKVADFGFARLLDEEYTMTCDEDTLGTPIYMAPEQFKGRPGNVCTDIYSLGVLLFEMWSGRVPFEPTSFYDLAIAHLREPLNFQCGFDDAPPWITQLIRKCCAKEPADRFRSVDELLRVLDKNVQPLMLAETSTKHSAMIRLQADEYRRRRRARFRAARRVLLLRVLPSAILGTIGLCRFNERASGDAAALLLHAEKAFDLDLSSIAPIFSVPWSSTRGEDVFSMVDDSPYSPKARKALSAITSLGGADVRNSSGETPLIRAIRSANIDALNIFVDQGASLRFRDAREVSPLETALRGESPMIAARLANLLPLEPCNQQGDNALLYVLRHRRYYILYNLSLFSDSADPILIKPALNFQNKFGQSALHLFGSQFPDSGILELLLKAGVDRNLQDLEGRTALMDSIRQRKFALASQLLEPASVFQGRLSPDRRVSEVDPNIQDRLGRTAVMYLIQQGDQSGTEEVWSKMLHHRPDLAVFDGAGDSALHYAIRAGSVELVRLLIRNGASCKIVHRNGISAVEAARAQGQWELVRLLSTELCVGLTEAL